MSKNNPGIHMPMPQAKMKPLTDEEKQARIMQFLAQKRETFALAILQGICSNPEIHAKNPVEEAVEMADHLLEKLYPIKEEESKCSTSE